jgi:cathepsin L
MSFRTTVAVAILSAALAGNVHDRSFYESKFYSWMTEHNVKIESGAKFVTMLQNFANNDDVIEAHNAKKSTYKLGHNKFSGMSNDEFKTYVNQGGYKKRTTPSGAKFLHNAPSDKSILKSEVNWVTAGAVTDVKDQGQCGSCWSFSTTGALEGAYVVNGGALTSMSEQYLVSCDNRKNGGTDMGCNGGLMDSAFEWSESNGVMSEASYPYTAGDGDSGSCLSTGTAVSGATPKSYTDVKANSDDAMMSALNQARRYRH